MSYSEEVRQYLRHLAERNIEFASKCHICKKQSTGINSDGYRISFVCDKHLEQVDDVIIDFSNPNVDHRIYPNGQKMSPEGLDPNVGGYIPRDKNEYK